VRANLYWKKVVAQGPSIKIAIGFVLNIWLRFAKNGERLESPHLDRQFPILCIELFGVLRRRRLRRRTPGPPPFSSMNSMPAARCLIAFAAGRSRARVRRSPAVAGKKRCRMHGGAPGSGAPRGNKNALRHGRYTREAIQELRQLRALLRQSLILVEEMK
jgi:hypothetical protein